MTVKSLNDVLNHARGLGLDITEQPIKGKLNAVLLPEGRVILNSNRTKATQRYAVAHECGHWEYGHDWRYQHDKARDEYQADRYAGQLLICPMEYSRAERIYEGHLGAIAAELLIPNHVLKLWQETNVDVAQRARHAS